MAYDAPPRQWDFAQNLHQLCQRGYELRFFANGRDLCATLIHDDGERVVARKVFNHQEIMTVDDMVHRMDETIAVMAAEIGELKKDG